MRAKDLREMDNDELFGQIEQLEKQIYENRFRMVTKELDNLSVVREQRKDLARIKTVLRERKIII